MPKKGVFDHFLKGLFLHENVNNTLDFDYFPTLSLQKVFFKMIVRRWHFGFEIAGGRLG
jgi:hypothetical protein